MLPHQGSIKVKAILLIILLTQTAVHAQSDAPTSLDASSSILKHPIGRTFIDGDGSTPEQRYYNSTIGTVTKISKNKNYFLTTFHTVKGCFTYGEIYKKHGFIVQDIIGTQNCDANSLGHTHYGKYDYVGKATGMQAGAKGIVVGPDSISLMLDKTDDYMKLLVEGYYYPGWGSSFDFAVIQIEKDEEYLEILKEYFGTIGKWESSEGCIPTKSIKAEEKIESYGFPHFDRPDDSNDFKPRYTSGKVAQSNESRLSYVKDGFGTTDKNELDSIFRIVFEETDNSRIYLGSLDTSKGSSGSAVLQNNAIVGMVYGGDPRSKYSYVENGTLFTGIDYIKDVLSLRGMDIDSVFSCL